MNDSHLQRLPGEIRARQVRSIDRRRKAHAPPGVARIGSLIKPENVPDAIHPQPIRRIRKAAWINLLNRPVNFIAQVVGSPFLRAEGSDSVAATNALLDTLRLRRKQGTLFPVALEPEIEPESVSPTGPKPVFYNFNPKSIQDSAGIFKDDPDIMEICAEIYRARDEEKRREFGE